MTSTDLGSPSRPSRQPKQPIWAVSIAAQIEGSGWPPPPMYIGPARALSVLNINEEPASSYYCPTYVSEELVTNICIYIFYLI
jgi:hypothetical protein